ncbi:unannotated protein [freshwater metagenome]|uniref:Unannotated protein n=1 Tax=freshwater metagenome TaxID=449393 RepID=A0A6J7F4F2_9ZZZZ
MRVDRLYTRATASQIASDIACAHRRDPALHRVRGMFAAEQWEAIWAPAENGPPGDHVVWVRLVPLR